MLFPGLSLYYYLHHPTFLFGTPYVKRKSDGMDGSKSRESQDSRNDQTYLVHVADQCRALGCVSLATTDPFRRMLG